MGSYLRGWDNANDGDAAMYNKITVIGFPCPLVNRQQVLELELTAGGNALCGAIQLNFERVKTIK